MVVNSVAYIYKSACFQGFSEIINNFLLKNLFKQQTEYIVLEDFHQFLNARNIFVLRYHVKEELTGIEEKRKLQYFLSENTAIPIYQYTFYEEKLSETHKSLLLQETEEFERLGMDVIAESIANAGADLRGEVRMPEEGESKEAYIEGLKEKIDVDDQTFLRAVNGQNEIYLIKHLLIILPLTEELLEAGAEVLTENIRGLTDTFNRISAGIQFKFVILQPLWEKYRKSFDIFMKNTIRVKVRRDDIEELISANINMEHLEDYYKYFNFMNHYSVSGSSPLADRHLLQNQYQKGVLALVLGTRKDVKLYSMPVIEYLADWLKEHPEKSYDMVLDCLKRAAAKELKENDEEYSDRLISFRYLVKELNSSAFS